LKFLDDVKSERTDQDMEMDREPNLIGAFEICYFQRIKSEENRKRAISAFEKAFGFAYVPENAVYVDFQPHEGLTFSSEARRSRTVLPTQSQQHHHLLKQADISLLLGQNSKSVENLVSCVNSRVPVLIVTDDTQKVQQVLSTIASLSNQAFDSVLLNDKTDTSQLLGCFEQTAVSLQALQAEVVAFLSDKPYEVENFKFKLHQAKTDLMLKLKICEQTAP
jgi:midasin (ATPase involved in ribosome maturation)